MKKEIKNILFDFGGVIVNLNMQNAINRFKEIGMTNIEDYLTAYRQSGIFLDYEIGKLNPEEFYAAFRELAGKEDISSKDIDSAWLAFLDGIPAYKFELLKELRKEYNVYLLSNTNPSVMAWADSKDFSPEGLPITAFFDKSYKSFQIGCAKPDERIFNEMIKDSGMIPSETLFLDDGPKNIEIAEKLGFKGYIVDQSEDLRQVFVDRGLLEA